MPFQKFGCVDLEQKGETYLLPLAKVRKRPVRRRRTVWRTEDCVAWYIAECINFILQSLHCSTVLSRLFTETFFDVSKAFYRQRSSARGQYEAEDTSNHWGKYSAQCREATATWCKILGGSFQAGGTRTDLSEGNKVLTVWSVKNGSADRCAARTMKMRQSWQREIFPSAYSGKYKSGKTYSILTTMRKCTSFTSCGVKIYISQCSAPLWTELRCAPPSCYSWQLTIIWCKICSLNKLRCCA